MLSMRLAAVSGLLVFAVACGSDYSAPPTTPSAPSPTPAPGEQSVSVSIPVGAELLGNRAYVPNELDVAVGTTVTWTNTDSTSHTSTSNVPGWNSGIVSPNGKFTVKLQTAGTFDYHCDIHPGMVGKINVR